MRQMLVRCYDHRVSQTGDFTDTGKGDCQRNALNLARLYFLHPLVHFSQPGRLYLRVVPVQVFRKTPYQFADLLGRPMAGFRHNLFQGHLHVLTLHHGHIGFSRVSEVEGGGLNRPQLSVPRFHFAPHQTGRAVFPHPAFRGTFTRIASTPVPASKPPKWATGTDRDVLGELRVGASPTGLYDNPLCARASVATGWPHTG